MQRSKTLCLLLVITGPVLAQERGNQVMQLWFDYIPTYPMGKWSFDCEVGPRIGFAESRWSELSAKPNWEYSATPWLDLVGGVALAYTHQTEDFDSFEVRPYVGLRPYFFTKRGIHGVKLVDFLRYEYRAQYTFKAEARNNSSRVRNRLQAVIPLNKASILLHGALSALVDVEAFFNTQDLQERFSSRLRVRLGAAYNYSTAFRFQLIYALQRSRDTLDEPFSTTDQILRFRVIHFF